MAFPFQSSVRAVSSVHCINWTALMRFDGYDVIEGGVGLFQRCLLHSYGAKVQCSG